MRKFIGSDGAFMEQYIQNLPTRKLQPFSQYYADLKAGKLNN